MSGLITAVCAHTWEISSMLSTSGRLERTWRCTQCLEPRTMTFEMPELPPPGGPLPPDDIIDALAQAGYDASALEPSARDQLACAVHFLLTEQRALGRTQPHHAPRPAASSCPSLTPVIHWLEGGCDRHWAATELRLYQKQLGQLPAPPLAQSVATAIRGSRHADTGGAANDEVSEDELLANVARSRGKYPSNRRLFDGMMGEVAELARAYRGDGNVHAEALDVAACALRIAIEGDAGGNSHPLLTGEKSGAFSPARMIDVADAVRRRLAECHQNRLLGQSSQGGANIDWARLEGAFKVVNALREEFGLPALSVANAG